MISKNERLKLVIYAGYAGLTDDERHKLQFDVAGVFSSKDGEFKRHAYELLMARLEEILWERVAAGKVRDPRNCRQCGARLIPLPTPNRGDCSQGCGHQACHAWTRTYWQDRLPKTNAASTRQIYRINELWTMLQDYLPEDRRNAAYLAGMASHAGEGASGCYLAAGKFKFSALTSTAANKLIAALQNRLRYAPK